MKVTLDLDQLLSEGEITQIEYNKLSELAAKSTRSLAFNILIGLSVIAVSGASLALLPAPTTAIVIGLFILIAGLALLRSGWEQWRVLSNICILVGALMTGGGVVTEFKGSFLSILSVTAIFTVAAIFARSTLLAVLATLMLSASIGARTGYFHASYFLVIQEPTITVILFSLLAIGLYHLSKKLSAEYEKIAIASARAGVFFVNFGFWVGSLWGERSEAREVLISDTVFSFLWALALLATAIWSWKGSRRWVLNTVAAFGGIHFYTQWFEHLGASPGAVLVAGLLALAFAVGLRSINSKMKENA
ncbi:hypothetical protein [Nitrosococcus watsonii]|uniref:DUF2157 domain-containing protein n=1 Tax=Nitrosococcus watsoni (strain C-113) TaxID=105559 RepID=D8KC32_NITWC|nr:hypothetical protein [Nitrosococcus watsonii]ADJ29703.1 conserved hypothetical protein [Nitrosococcus watsonii C-113]